MSPKKARRPEAEKTGYRSAMDTALRLLAGRRHTRRELARKLAKRDVDDDTAGAVIARCEGLGYVDDAETALLFVDALKAKGYGRRHAWFTMQEKGFAVSLIEDGLARRYPPVEEAAAALRMAAKKRKGLKAGREQREKVYRYLLSRGFSIEAVNGALAAVFSADT